MADLYLIRIGEIGLKKGNRAFFERLLKQRIKAKLGSDGTAVTIRTGRFYLETEEEPEKVDAALRRIPGIVGFSRANRSPPRSSIAR